MFTFKLQFLELLKCIAQITSKEEFYTVYDSSPREIAQFLKDIDNRDNDHHLPIQWIQIVFAKKPNDFMLHAFIYHLKKIYGDLPKLHNSSFVEDEEDVDLLVEDVQPTSPQNIVRSQKKKKRKRKTPKKRSAANMTLHI